MFVDQEEYEDEVWCKGKHILESQHILLLLRDETSPLFVLRLRVDIVVLIVHLSQVFIHEVEVDQLDICTSQLGHVFVIGLFQGFNMSVSC